MATLVAVYLSRTYVSLAEFPTYSIGDRVASATSDGVDWFTDTFGGATEWIKDLITNQFLNRTQALLADSPWWLAFAAIAALLVVQPSLNQSLGKALERSVGVIAGVVIASALALAFGQSTWVVVLAVAVGETAV